MGGGSPKSPKSYNFIILAVFNLKLDENWIQRSSSPYTELRNETFQTIPLTTPEKGGGLFKPCFYNARSRSRRASRIDTLIIGGRREGGGQSLAEEVFQRIVVAIARNLSSGDRLRMAQLPGLPPVYTQ